MHPTASPGLDRRGFLKVSLVGSGLLLGASVLGSVQGCATHQLATQPERPLKVLRDKDAAILSAVAPVVLKGAFPVEPQPRREALDRLLVQIDTFLSHSSEYAHGEFKKLFDLMYLPVTRVLLTGLWSRWETASDADIEDFLLGWRDSFINDLRMGYAQLTQLTSLVYYSDPASWTADIYPGPPQHLPG